MMNIKMKKILCIIGIAYICFTLSNVHAENDKINERLIRVEETVKNLDIRLTQRIDDTNKRIDDLKQDMNRRFIETNQAFNKRFDESQQAFNKRFDESQQEINRRFDESNLAINRRFDDSRHDIDNLHALMYVILASLFSILTMICGLIVYIVKKDRKETAQSKDQKDIIPDLKIIVKKVDTLENDFKEKVLPLWEYFNNQDHQSTQFKYANI